MIINGRLMFTAALVVLMCAPQAARSGELDLTGSLSSFTSSTGI